MYNPIIGAAETYSGHEPLSTPQSTLKRAAKLQEAYAELKTDLLEEVNMVDVRIMKPATDAKEYLHPMKKVIKKREDRKVSKDHFVIFGHSLIYLQLDFERYQGRVDNARKKTKRSERDNASLEKSEADLARAKEVCLTFFRGVPRVISGGSLYVASHARYALRTTLRISQ